MKLLQLLAIFVLIFATVSIADASNYSIRSVWECFRKKDECSCACDEKWEDNAQKYFDGCEDATSQYLGDANQLAAVVMDSFRQYLTKLMEYANSNTTTLSGSANSMLRSISKCNKLGKSSMLMLVEFEKIFPTVANDLKNVALNLRGHIGNLAQSFSDAVQELSWVFSKYMRELVLSCRLTGCKKTVCYEPTLQKMQKLMNMVVRISATLLKECNPSIEAQESVLVLVLIAWYFQIVVQGKVTTTMDLLLRHSCEISPNLKALSISFDYVLVTITQAISGVVVSVFKTINEFLGTFVNTISALNTAIKDILGVVDGVVITVGEIARNLFKGLQITSTSTGLTNILNGVPCN